MPDAMNEAQRQAVMHGEGPLLVLAGPGSGKTFVITRRIQYLINEMQVPPEQILVITFTREAAQSMEQRFQQSSPQILPVNFGTFHSIFFHILQQSGALQGSQLLKDSQKRNLIISILNQYLTEESSKNQRNGMTEDAIQVLSAISYYKNTGSLEQAAEKLTGAWKEHFPDICKQYEKALMGAGGIDFDDMVFLCRKLLKENRKQLAYWQMRFSHILMDEFQDINPMQYEVIRLLTSAPYNLFAVGDDDQAIYGFRGSSPACLKQFEEDYQAKKVYLNINYRSYPGVVEASLAVIGENKDRFWKELKAHSQISEKAVTLYAFPEREQQYEHLLKIFSESSQESRAVLFRTNAFLQGFAARLSREGIPFEMKEKMQGIYEHFICRDIMAYLQLAGGATDRACLLSIMNKPSRYINREALSGETINFRMMQEYYKRRELEQCGRETDFRTRWQKQEANRIREVLKQLRMLEMHLYKLRQMPPYLAIRYICKAVGYERYLQELAAGRVERLQEWREYLEWLTEDARQYTDNRQWQQAQEDYKKALEEARDSGVTEKATNHAEQGKKLQLMTVHASKGLEFDRVWIPDCNEKVFPHGKMPDKTACEEERRIFYVAMTRAKKSLELLYLVGTKERPRLPSRFLNPLLQREE